MCKRVDSTCAGLSIYSGRQLQQDPAIPYTLEEERHGLGVLLKGEYRSARITGRHDSSSCNMFPCACSSSCRQSANEIACLGLCLSSQNQHLWLIMNFALAGCVHANLVVSQHCCWVVRGKHAHLPTKPLHALASQLAKQCNSTSARCVLMDMYGKSWSGWGDYLLKIDFSHLLSAETDGIQCQVGAMHCPMLCVTGTGALQDVKDGHCVPDWRLWRSVAAHKVIAKCCKRGTCSNLCHTRALSVLT